MYVLNLLGMAVAVFAVTNLDDLFLLGLFFSDRTLRRRHVVVGQHLGIGVLVAMSGIGGLISLAVPAAWIALLGLVPLLIGLWKLRGLWSANGDNALASTSGSTVLAVTGVTVANGGDNLGVYIPYFASLTLWEVGLTIAVFMAMTAVWCVAALWLLRHRRIAHAVERFGHILLPIVLIGLGLWILAGALPLVGIGQGEALVSAIGAAGE